MSIFGYMRKKIKIPLIPRLNSWVFFLFITVCLSANAQIYPKLSVLEIDRQVKTLIDPIKGLNNDMRAGLIKIEQTCNIIAKSKLDESKRSAFSNPDPQTAVMRAEINAAKQTTLDQSETVTKYVQETRIKLASQSRACDGLSSLLKTSDACNAYKTASEALNHVNDAAVYYYGEALARLGSYESAFELEQKGLHTNRFFSAFMGCRANSPRTRYENFCSNAY